MEHQERKEASEDDVAGTQQEGNLSADELANQKSGQIKEIARDIKQGSTPPKSADEQT